MKIYAKIKSDRASQGQGGNKKIEVDLFIGNAKEPVAITRFTLSYDKPFYYLYKDDLLIGQWVEEKDNKIKNITL